MVRASVVLPDPDWPTRAATSPAAQAIVTWSTARIRWPRATKSTTRSSTASSGDAAFSARAGSTPVGHLEAVRPADAAPRGRVADLREGRCQLPGVGVLRVHHHLVRRTLLDDPPVLHDDDPVAHRGEDGQVVADHHQGQGPVADQSREHVEDLRLDDDVEGRRGLVGDDDVRVAGERHGDHDPLLLAAGQLVRVGLRLLGREVDHLQQRAHPGGPRRRRGGGRRTVQLQGLGDLPAHGADRVQRAHGPLEDDRALGPPHRSQPAPAHRREVLAAQLDGPGQGRVARQQPEGRHRQGGLPAARLPGDADRSPRLDGEVDAVDGDHLGVVAAAGGVRDPDVPPGQRGFRRRRLGMRGHQRRRSVGLSTDSRARPTRVKQRTTTTMARPGGRTYHQ